MRDRATIRCGYFGVCKTRAPRRANISPVSETSFESKPFKKTRKPTIDAGELFDRSPPHHIDAERSLLGSILLDPMVLTEVVEIVSTADQFYKESHGTIFACLLETFEAHQTGDLVQLAEGLRAKGVLEQVGGSGYLMELAEAVPSAANAPYYAKLIADSCRLRKLIDAAGQIMYEAYTQGGGTPGAAKDVVDQAEKRIFDIASEDINAEPDSLKELLMQEMLRIEQAEGENDHWPPDRVRLPRRTAFGAPAGRNDDPRGSSFDGQNRDRTQYRGTTRLWRVYALAAPERRGPRRGRGVLAGNVPWCPDAASPQCPVWRGFGQAPFWTGDRC